MAISVNGLYPGELTPDETIGGCIDIFENAWPNPQDTIVSIEKEVANTNSGLYWRRAETMGHGAYQTARTNSILDITHFAEITNNGLMQNIHNQFYISLLASTIPYARKFNIHENLYHEGYSILKYGEGQEYLPHYDGTGFDNRIISALVYLNDDYTGGELEFINFKVKIKPTPGMMILFPSNFAYMHTAHPVKEGIKYSLVTWIRDREM